VRGQKSVSFPSADSEIRLAYNRAYPIPQRSKLLLNGGEKQRNFNVNNNNNDSEGDDGNDKRAPTMKCDSKINCMDEGTQRIQAIHCANDVEPNCDNSEHGDDDHSTGREGGEDNYLNNNINNNAICNDKKSGKIMEDTAGFKLNLPNQDENITGEGGGEGTSHPGNVIVVKCGEVGGENCLSGSVGENINNSATEDRENENENVCKDNHRSQ